MELVSAESGFVFLAGLYLYQIVITYQRRADHILFAGFQTRVDPAYF